MSDMTRTKFTDPSHGPILATIQPLENAVTVTVSIGSNPEIQTIIPKPDAIKLAYDILAAAGEKASPRSVLPQSRQIGGIIGPY